MSRGACVHVHVRLKFVALNQMLDKHNYNVVSVRGVTAFHPHSCDVIQLDFSIDACNKMAPWMANGSKPQESAHLFSMILNGIIIFERIKWNWRATAWKARPLFKCINDIRRVLESMLLAHTHFLPTIESTATGNEHYTTKRNASKQTIVRLANVTTKCCSAPECHQLAIIDERAAIWCAKSARKNWLFAGYLILARTWTVTSAFFRIAKKNSHFFFFLHFIFVLIIFQSSCMKFHLTNATPTASCSSLGFSLFRWLCIGVQGVKSPK